MCTVEIVAITIHQQILEILRLSLKKILQGIPIVIDDLVFDLQKIQHFSSGMHGGQQLF